MLLHVFMFVNEVSDMFICVCRRSAASLRRLASACFAVFATALYIHLYIIFYYCVIRGVMFRELRLVWEMRVGRVALGRAQRGERLAAELRGRLEKLPA